MVSHRVVEYTLYTDICLEKIRGPGAMYGDVMLEQRFGAEMSMHNLHYGCEKKL